MTAPTPDQSASEPNFPDASYSRERLELETRVLAAALRQSLEIGDTEGSSLAHEQIFLLLKASQDMVVEETPPVIEVPVERSRQMPDIDWGDSGTSLPSPAEVVNAPEIFVDEPTSQVITSPDPFEIIAEVLAEVPAEVSTEEFAELPAEIAAEAPAELTRETDAEMPGESVEEPQTDFHVESPQQNLPLVKQSSVVDTIVDGDAVPAALVKEEATDEPKTWVEGAPPVNYPATTSATTESNVNDYYAHLNVAEVADFASIHLSFLRQLRVLLKAEKGVVGLERQPMLKQLQKLWIAHDVLCDPVTRADYDFRKMGLRGGKEVVTKSSHGPRTQLRIGELLQCAGLLEQTELDIAADMHKAMPEMMFGTFLVRQGFIEEEDLNCVLIGQQLLKTGDITVVQFQTVMLERSASGLDIGEMLRAKGYVSASQLERAYRNQSEDTLVRMPIVTTSASAPALEFKSEPRAEVQAQAENGGNTMQAPPAVSAPGLNRVGERSFNFGNAAPAWKDQLDWSSPEESPEPQPHVPEAAPEISSETATETLIETTPETVPTLDQEPVILDEPAAQVLETADQPAVVAQSPAADIYETSERQAVSGTFSMIENTETLPQHPSQPSRWAAPDVVAKFASESVSYNDYDDAPYQLEVRPPDMSETARTIAQIWQDESDSHSSWGEPAKSSSSYPFVPQAPPQPASHAPQSGAAPGDGDDQDNPFYSSSGDSGLQGRFIETETSGNLPSLNELEMRTSEQNSDREQAEQDAYSEEEHQERKRGTGDWQIMSVPATALTSLFLDEQVEPQSMQNASPPHNQTDTGPQKIYQTEVSSKQAIPEPPQPVPPAAANQKDSRESRKERRRRTRH